MRIESRLDSRPGQVDVRRCRVAGLVDRDRARLLGDVLDADRRAGLDRRHRLDEVLPGERVAAVVVGVVSAIEQTCSIIAGE